MTAYVSRVDDLVLHAAGARESVTEAHAAFVPLNRRFGRACTAWQTRPERGSTSGGLSFPRAPAAPWR